jgi:hypothetical protein
VALFSYVPLATSVCRSGNIEGIVAFLPERQPASSHPRTHSLIADPWYLLPPWPTPQGLLAHNFYVAVATSICCDRNMEAVMHSVLNSIFQRRAIRVFEPVEISPALRDELLEAARVARSRNGHDHRDRQEISSSH